MADPLPTRPDETPAVKLVDAKQLSPVVSLKVRTIRSHDASGKLPEPIRLGGKVLWRLDEIHDWIAAGCPDRETWNTLRAARTR